MTRVEKNDEEKEAEFPDGTSSVEMENSSTQKEENNTPKYCISRYDA